MDKSSFKAAQNLLNSIAEKERIVEVLTHKTRGANETPRAMLTEFLNNMNNVSSTTYKDTLAEECIRHILRYVKDEITIAENKLKML